MYLRGNGWTLGWFDGYAQEFYSIRMRFLCCGELKLVFNLGDGSSSPWEHSDQMENDEGTLSGSVLKMHLKCLKLGTFWSKISKTLQNIDKKLENNHKT